MKGDGIEVGPLHSPLKVPRSARVTFVDRMPVAQLREQYPELKNVKLVEPDVVDDGEKLKKFEDSSQDFIIANHFLEHCQDPIGAFEGFLRVLKEGGILYLALPDMRSTFDKDREVSAFDHLLRDYREGAVILKSELASSTGSATTPQRSRSNGSWKSSTASIITHGHRPK